MQGEGECTDGVCRWRMQMARTDREVQNELSAVREERSICYVPNSGGSDSVII